MNRLGFALAALGLAAANWAQAADPLSVSHAWARATVPGQAVGAAYMELRSTADATLVRVESPAADSVEIHRMTMRDGVMEMRMLETLELPAGKVVKLEPGGFHLMLFDLKKPLKAGERVAFTLHLRDRSGKTTPMQLEVPVKRSAD